MLKNTHTGICVAIIALAILFAGFTGIAEAAFGFTGHQPTTNIGYTDGTHARAYTAAPNMLQNAGFLNQAKSDIWQGSAADVYVNFQFDTGGKNVFIVYTTDSSTPTKSNGTSVNGSFSKYSEPDRTWFGTIPSQSMGTLVKYVFYISDSDLASAWGRVGFNGYVTSWTEGDDPGFSYLTLGPNAITLSSLTARAAGGQAALPLLAGVFGLAGLGVGAYTRRRR